MTTKREREQAEYVRQWNESQKQKFDEPVRDAPNLFDELMNVPSPAHHDDADTAVDARAKVTVKRGAERHRLLIAFKDNGALTDDEAGELANVLGEYDARRHCSDLRRGSYIERNGERGTTRRGSPAMKCVITANGLRVIGELAKADALTQVTVESRLAPDNWMTR
jgi:hypothetical protein